MKRLRFSRTTFVVFIAMFLVSLIASSVFAGGPTGGSPNDPLMVPTDWQNIPPNTTLWFYFDYASDVTGGRFRPGSRTTVNITVDTQGIEGLQLAIYTPVQGKEWLRDQTIAPVGRGTPYRSTATGDITRDLYWSGAFNTSGRYFAALTNNYPVAIPFRLTVTGDTVTLYPTPLPSPTPTLLITPTPVAVGATQGRIVFQDANGGVIYTVNGDGTNLTIVTRGMEPAWSPDGKQIAFARWDAPYPGIYIANADGSNERLVYGVLRARSPRWSPDGKFIAFTQDKTTSDRNVRWKLGVIELEHTPPGTDQVVSARLSEPQCSALCFVPSWSNNGATLVYDDPQYGIMATNVISGPASIVLGPSGTYFDTGAMMPRPILHLPPIQSAMTSPNGTRILYTLKAHDRWELNMVNADGTNQVALTNPDPIMYAMIGYRFNNVAPIWSPDGKQILFLSDRNGKWEFFLTDPSGSTIRQVLKNVSDLVPIRFDFENERMMDWTK
ncbi:MAG: PD40 domain-containing protein [Chloroflexi bacterium]|nr:PD40 domain-containing protein [Chloroflexota bacterium]